MWLACAALKRGGKDTGCVLSPLPFTVPEVGNYATCEQDGNWSASHTPVCKLKGCPSQLVKGDGYKAQLPESASGATAVIHCDSGKGWVGSSRTLRCVGAKWKGALPLCIYKGCSSWPLV
eukprot:TRINITY_DN268_c0_g1_i3.p1 TRINITY_DN268_c0_g1~~TRINITY_DN268_c0_g1_i3.p1  ORF type:complete len:120 (-),score=4.28 TRINITY_DN268_c0_g1_i3:5-364(-)